MFNSIALDVVISLILIYLLYSLLVTIIGEIIATRLKLRARMLITAIESMLLDDNLVDAKKNWTDIFILRLFRVGKVNNGVNSLADRFFNYPSIKYLGKNEHEKRPSYISQENFSETLFNMLREKGTGVDDMAKIDFCLNYNTINIGDETKKQIANLFQTAALNPDVFKSGLQKWFNDTMDRVNGWYKRSVRIILFFIGLCIAMSFNVDSIKIAQKLSKDKGARDLLVQMAINFSKDSARYQKFMVIDGDTLRNQAAVDSGYKQIKKDIKDANKILGLGWGFDTLKKVCIYNVETKKNSLKINSIYNKLIAKNIRNIDSLNVKIKTLSDTIYNKRENKFRLQIIKGDMLYQRTLSGYNADTIKKIFAKSNDQITAINNTLSAQTSLVQLYTDSIFKLKKNNIPFYKQIDTLVGNKFARIDSIGQDCKTIYGLRYFYWKEKLSYFFHMGWSKFFGFLITALALSLGAPFWFDWLKKLISIRGSGIKPEEKDEYELPLKPSPGALPAFIPPVNPPVDLDPVQQFIEKIKTFVDVKKDIVAIAIGYGTNQTKFLEVKVLNAVVLKLLQQKWLNRFTLNDTTQIPINYTLVQNRNITHDAKSGSEIKNAQKKVQGTLGCYLKSIDKNDTNTYFISCWHVLKDDNIWARTIDQRSITSSDDKEIGSVVSGYLSNNLDMGVAVCKDVPSPDDKQTLIKYQYRQLFPADSINSTKVKILSKRGSIEAQIIYEKTSASINYPDGVTYIIEDLFSVSIKNPDGNYKAPTIAGDSGSIVIDDEGYPLGMIIAGNDVVSYAIKFTNAFNKGCNYSSYRFII